MLGMRRLQGGGERLVTLVDVGSTKISCLIAAVAPWVGARGAPAIHPGQPLPARILGLGHQRSRGIKAGVVIDLNEAEQAIRAAVSQAERAAGLQIEEVIVSVSCGRLKSHNFAASADIASGTVGPADISRVMAGARAFAERDGRSLVHLNRIAFRLDGANGIEQPLGMSCRSLTADVHAVTADEAPLRNLLTAVERGYLTIAGVVAAPYASALATTDAEERRLGVAAIDLGGGTSSIAVFADGHFLYTDAIAVGGTHITYDIARALSTPLAEAERIKTLYASVSKANSDANELVSYTTVGADEGSELLHTTKARIGDMVRARIEQILDLLAERLTRSGLSLHATERVVLTGGMSQLPGLADAAANRLGRAVRIGRPEVLPGLSSSATSPAFSTVVGLLQACVAVESGAVGLEGRQIMRSANGGYLERVGGWFRESF